MERTNNRKDNKDKTPKGEFRLFKKLSVAATALLSLLATVEANSPNDQGPIWKFAESTSSVPGVSNTETNVGLHDILPGKGEVPAFGFGGNLVSYETYQIQEDGSWEKSGVPVDKTHVLTWEQPMEWARLFDQDPDARKAVDEARQVKFAANAIKQLVEDDNYTIKNIKIIGGSSAEGNPGEPDAGLWLDNPENERLAKERAAAVEAMLVTELESAGVADKIPPITTSWEEVLDPALNQEIIELADTRGETPYDMLFNRSQRKNLDSFTQSDLEMLEKFAQHRRAVIVVEVIEHDDEMVYKEGEMIDVTERRTEGSIVVIPILLGWRSRRKNPLKLGGGLIGPDSAVLRMPASVPTTTSAEPQQGVSGTNSETVTDALGFPTNHSAKRGAVFTDGYTGSLSPKSEDIIRKIVNGQESTDNGALPPPVVIWPRKSNPEESRLDPEPNPPSPKPSPNPPTPKPNGTKQQGSRARVVYTGVRNNGVKPPIKQPTSSNNGTSRNNVNRSGRQ